jgi:ribose/xylose/arabinose/galactoside ABC-type transport system permease subunit
MNLIGVGYEWQQVAIGIILILSVSLDKLKSGQQT